MENPHSTDKRTSQIQRHSICQRVGCTLERLASKAWRTRPEPYKHSRMCITSILWPRPNPVANFCLQMCFSTTQSWFLLWPYSASTLTETHPRLHALAPWMLFTWVKQFVCAGWMGTKAHPPTGPLAWWSREPALQVFSCLRRQTQCSKWSHQD